MNATRRPSPRSAATSPVNPSAGHSGHQQYEPVPRGTPQRISFSFGTLSANFAHGWMLWVSE